MKDLNKYTVTVKKGEITVQSITNKKEKISIPVIKKWQGYKELSVTVKLFADGMNTGQKFVLNESGNWKGKFENLDKYKETKEIKYTVKKEGEKAEKITFNGREYVVTVKGDQKQKKNQWWKNSLRPDAFSTFCCLPAHARLPCAGIFLAFCMMCSKLFYSH